MPKTTGKSFNVILSLKEYESLAQLSIDTHTSMSHVLRSTLRAAVAMTVAHTPTCANGSPCFVPQMHKQPPGHTEHTPPPTGGA